MELKRLIIDGFRGLYTELDFSHNTIVRAGNGKGKTTIMNAILWVLCGSDDADRTNYNLFDNNLPSDDPYAPLTASVTAEFDSIVLTRTATQLWGKDKNDMTKLVRKGDDYKYLVNDMEVNSTRFKEMIETQLMPISKLKFVLNVHYWEILSEKELRDQIKDLASADIKPTDSRYDGVLWAINESGIINAKKHFSKRATEHENQAKKLKIEIAATRKRMPQGIIDTESLKSQLSQLQSEIDEINKQIDSAVPVDILSKRQNEENAIYNFKWNIQNIEIKYNADNKAELLSMEAKLNDVKCNNERIKNARLRIQELQKRLEVLNVDYNQKKDEYRKIQSRIFTGLCPTCGHALDGNSRIEQLNTFKAQKQREEEVVITEGQRFKKQINDTQKEIEDCENVITELSAINGASNKITLEYERLKRRCEIPFKDTEEYAKLAAQLAELESNRTELPISNVSEEIKVRKGELITKIQEVQSKITITERDNKEYERLEKELQRLENQKESYLRRMAESNNDLSLVKEYEIEWMHMLEDEINSNFSDIRIQMNDVNKMGDAIDCCKIRMANVKDTLNNASRIIVGLSISEALQKRYSTNMPVLIDECESIEESNIPNISHQMIRFYVDQNGGDIQVEHR